VSIRHKSGLSPWARLQAERNHLSEIVSTVNEKIALCRSDIVFLLKLRDAPVDGKWDYPTIRRIDEIRKRVGA
jgi:hypothetical protein